MNRKERFSNENLGNVPVEINKKFASEFVGTPIYFGTLEDGSEVVLKFNSLEGGAEREFFGLTLAYNNQVPTSRPISMITRDSDPSLGFMMEKVEGKPFRDFSTEFHERLFALVLLKLHSIEVGNFGLIHTGEAINISYSDYLDMWMKKTVPYMSENGADMNLFHHLKNQGDSHMRNQTPRLLHRDPKDENVLITPDGQVSLIDFEWSQGGSPLDDIAVYLYHAIRTDKQPSRVNEFMRAYFGEKDLDSAKKHDLLFHLMLASGRTVSYCSRFNTERLDEAVLNMNKTTDYIKRVLT